MAKFISVLNSNLSLPHWEAVQWGDTLSSVYNNPYYRAGYSQNYPKNSSDSELEEKQITEVSTQTQARVTIIKLNATSVNYMKLASNKASKTFLKKLKL